MFATFLALTQIFIVSDYYDRPDRVEERVNQKLQQLEASLNPTKQKLDVKNIHTVLGDRRVVTTVVYEINPMNTICEQ